MPVENVLGVSALESRWGESRFAVNGNNYFGLHYPAPHATGYLMTLRGNARVATFASYADSARSFAAVVSSFAPGVANPAGFAAALYNSGKFGVGEATYARDVTRTILGLRPLVSRRRI